MTQDVRLNRLAFDRMVARIGDRGITEAEERDRFALWQDRYFLLDADLGAPREAAPAWSSASSGAGSPP